ncbi:MAG: alkaline phosphatase D family protein [Pseudomonadota bacterium]
MPPLDRRSFLKGAAASAALGVAGCGDSGLPSVAMLTPSPTPSSTPPSFKHAVASGDPLPDAVILWTRLSDVSADTPVQWQIALDPAFAQVTASGTAMALAASDYTVKVDATGLMPDTRYFYCFSSSGVTSPTGRTRTAPVAAVPALRFAVVTCSDITRGLYNAYARVAELEDVQAVIHLGDYIYETGRIAVRPHDPPRRITTLPDYRRRYASYRETVELQNVHIAHPMIWVWDDHETCDAAWRNGADPADHEPDTDGPWEARRAAGMQAAIEWLPIRLPEAGRNERIYRHFSFGPLADLTMIDTRQFDRSQQIEPNLPMGFTQSGDFIDPARSILGMEQEAWVAEQFARTGHGWRLIGNQVIVAPLKIAGTPRALGTSVFANNDQWDGYEPARDRFLDAAAAVTVENMVVLTGDVHASMAFDIARDPNNPASYVAGTGLGSEGVEFVTPSISSGGDQANPASETDDPEALVEALITAGSEALRASNPHLKLFDASKNGYLLLTLTPQSLRADFWLVPTVLALTDEQVLAYRFDVAAGSNTLVEDLTVRAAAAAG